MSAINTIRQTVTILVIEDNNDVRGWLTEVLSEAGYSIRSASDGSSAVSELSKAPVDLLITDIIMPGMEGMETIQAIRRGFPEVKIIAMSGANASYLKMAHLLGANATLQKPFSGDEILLTVQQLLGSSAGFSSSETQ